VAVVGSPVDRTGRGVSGVSWMPVLSARTVGRVGREGGLGPKGLARQERSRVPSATAIPFSDCHRCHRHRTPTATTSGPAPRADLPRHPQALTPASASRLPRPRAPGGAGAPARPGPSTRVRQRPADVSCPVATGPRVAAATGTRPGSLTGLPRCARNVAAKCTSERSPCAGGAAPATPTTAAPQPLRRALAPVGCGVCPVVPGTSPASARRSGRLCRRSCSPHPHNGGATRKSGRPGGRWRD
jgi:hypothetical protein